MYVAISEITREHSKSYLAKTCLVAFTVFSCDFRNSNIQGNIVQVSMLSNKWSDKVYSFEDDYSSESYNLSIEPDGDSITDSQLEAWNSANLVGSVVANKIKALGDQPTVDIPVIVKVVKKSNDISS